MAVGSPPLPYSLDPLIAEAKQRARRRRALALSLLVVIGGAAAGTYLGLRGPSAAALGGSSARGFAATPLVDYGGAMEGYNGFMGDSGSATTVTTLGCINRRHYEEAFPLRNRSHIPVTVLSAQWRSSAPGIIQWAATQVRLPPYRSGVIQIVSRNWSARPTRPVTIQPGRYASLQSNFIFRHCAQLAGGRSVAGPGSLTIRYRASGRVRQTVLKPSSQAFFLGAGPRRQTCAPVAGATSLIASNISCADARQAALACHRLSQKTFGRCGSGNVRWLCDRTFGRDRPHRESCEQEKKSRRIGSTTLPRGFEVRWKPAT